MLISESCKLKTILKPRNYKASVIVDSLDDLPEEFKQTKTEVTADKKSYIRF